MQHEIVTTLVPLGFTYKNRVGQAVERYIRALGEKKILGARCPKCRKVYVPPRTACGGCAARVSEADFVEVSPEGTLEGWTEAHVRVETGEFQALATPQILGLIRLKGVDSLVTAVVRPGGGHPIARGAPVRAVWKEPAEGSLGDLEAFVVTGAAPAGGKSPQGKPARKGGGKR